jgi:hypothetical protein
VCHLPKPIVFSQLADRLVGAVTATAERAHALHEPVVLPPAHEPQATQPQETEKQVEDRAARAWLERTGRETAAAEERAVEKELERQDQLRSSADPLGLIRERSKQPGPKAQAEWRAQKAEQQAAGAIALSDSKTTKAMVPPILVVEGSNCFAHRGLIQGLCQTTWSINACC